MIDVPVRVRDSLKDGLLNKRYRIQVLNNDDSVDFALDNTVLVSESVKLTERICSGDTLKFGLSEGSDFEFQYFGFPDITGRRIRAFIDCYYRNDKYVDVVEDYIISKGKMIFPTKGIESGTQIILSVGPLSKPPFEFGATYRWTDQDGYHEEVNVFSIALFKSDMLSDIEIISNYVQNFHATYRSKDAMHTIPMGFFTVDQCSRQASTGIVKATCYNKLQSPYLDKNIKDQVCALIERGEGGVAGQMTINTLLSELLDGYKLVPSTVREVTPTTNSSQIINVDVERYYDYNSGYWDYDKPFYVCMCDIVVSDINNPYGEDNKTTEEFYNYKIDVQGLWDFMSAYHYTPAPDRKDAYEQYIYRHYLDETKTEYTDYKLKDFKKLEWSEAAGFAFVGIEKREYVDDFFSTTQTVSEDYFAESDIDKKWTYPNLVYSSYLQHGNIETGFVSTYNGIHLKLPLAYVYDATNRDEAVELCRSRAYRIMESIGQFVTIEKRVAGAVENKRFPLEIAQACDTITLRDIQSSVFELFGQFGKLDRNTDLFSSTTLNKNRLLPQTTLYPYGGLYPSGNLELGHPAMYSKLWANEDNIHNFRYIYFKYKDENGNEVSERVTANPNGTDDYYMEDNWLLNTLTWTWEEAIKAVNVMLKEIKGISWFPFEMWCAGLPYLEAGDEIEVMVNNRPYTSYVLTRTLSGIQDLEDTYCNGSLNIF